jgi:hypothetical protein
MAEQFLTRLLHYMLYMKPYMYITPHCMRYFACAYILFKPEWCEINQSTNFRTKMYQLGYVYSLVVKI